MPGILDLSVGAVLPRRIISARGGVSLLPPYLTIEENPNDQVTITQHPVDVGAAMSDHIFIRPPEVTLILGWSNADLAAGGDAAFVRNVYLAILRIKNARQLVGVYTGKRFYTNMFPADIRGPRTDRRYEWSMIVEVHFRQLLLVNLSARPGSPANTAAANNNPNNQSNPTVTQPSESGGARQPTVGPQYDDGQIPSGSPAVVSIPVDISQLPINQLAIPNSNGGASGPPPDMP